MTNFSTATRLALLLLCAALAQTYSQETSCDLGMFQLTQGMILIASVPTNSIVFQYNAANVATIFNPTTEYGYSLTFAYPLNGPRDANFTIRFSTDAVNAVRASGTARDNVGTIMGFVPVCSNLLIVEISSYRAVPMQGFDQCQFNYNFNITTPTNCTFSSVIGDPLFRGLHGQTYQVHGIDGVVYNIISARDYALNSRFKFIGEHRPCPIIPSTGRRSVTCWSHPGSYLQNLAAITSANERILIESGDHVNGFSTVELNGRKLQVGDAEQFSEGRISFNSTHEIELELGAFQIYVENNNEFINLAKVRVIGSPVELSKDGGVHGLLGQTWRNKQYPSQKLKEIEGEVDDYATFDDDMYGTDFVFNRFQLK